MRKNGTEHVRPKVTAVIESPQVGDLTEPWTYKIFNAVIICFRVSHNEVVTKASAIKQGTVVIEASEIPEYSMLCCS